MSKRVPPILRVDTNQAAIVAALRGAGASVQCLHTIGRGCPDLLVGWQGKNILMEVKDGKADLTPDEQKWRAGWRGQFFIVRSVEDALYILFDRVE